MVALGMQIKLRCNNHRETVKILDLGLKYSTLVPILGDIGPIDELIMNSCR